MEENSERRESIFGIKQQALISLIPCIGIFVVIALGVPSIKTRRGTAAAVIFYMLCSAVLFAVIVAFVLTLLLSDMPKCGLTVFAVSGAAVLIWGTAYIALLIETAFLHGTKVQADCGGQPN